MFDENQAQHDMHVASNIRATREAHGIRQFVSSILALLFHKHHNNDGDR